MTGIAQWIASLGLDKYAGAFADAEIDLDVLRDLTEADLERLGIPLGPRKKLLKAIAALRDAGAGGATVVTSSPSTATPPRPEAERRQLTVMFADMVGSTALSQGMDPEELREVIRSFQDAAAGAVARFDGYVAKFMGDGLLAYFGWPQAHEDDAERAVRAGLALVEVAGQLKHPQQVRVGIATGLVVVGDVLGAGGAREEAAIGETLNLAARLQGEAPPGGVLVAPETRALLGGLFELEALGPRALKGLSAPVETWRVVREVAADSRFEASRALSLTRLVGREQELALVLARWEQAKAGEGQVVLLRAEPGIGKSRIVAELRQRVDQEAIASLRYQCSPHHISSALYPIIQQIGRAARIEPNDPAHDKRCKLADLAHRSGIESPGSVALLSALLSVPPGAVHPAPRMTPQEQKVATLSLLVDWLAGLAATDPVLVIVEDLHWADPTTRELFDLIVGRIERLPVLLVVTFRPEIEAPWQGRGHATMVTLNRLGRRQVEALIAEVAQGRSLPAVAVEQIVAKADGVPLFVEELTKTILESGLLKTTGDRLELTGPLLSLAVPSSLQASLVSRLDRLAPIREVAQIGAALGREFDFELLAAVAPHSPDELAEALTQLHRAELIFPRGNPPRTVWAFKHALIQDAAYETMLRSARVQLHSRIAQVLKGSFPALVELEPEVYARHLTEAGVWRDAINAWQVAARRAARRSATQEAASLFRRAIGLTTHLDDATERNKAELELQIGLGSALIAQSGFGDVETGATYGRALELSLNVVDPMNHFQALNGLWKFHMVRGELDQTLQLALESKRISESISNDGLALEAENALGVTYYHRGVLDQAIPHLESAAQIYDFDRHSQHVVDFARDPGVNCNGYLGLALAWRGYPERAKRQLAKTVELARRRDHRLSIWIAYYNAGAASFALGDFEMTMQYGRLLHSMYKDHGFELGLLNGLAYINWVKSHDDPGNCSIKDLERGSSIWKTAWGPTNALFYELMLADALFQLGRIEEAASLLDSSLKTCDRVGNVIPAAEIFRLRARIHRIDGDLKAAETGLWRAIQIAEAQGANWARLSPAIDLAELLADRGDKAEAYALLHPIACWFTEGLDMPPLKRARLLLGQLASST
jgi:class 3 adenylate cyclase/tetratricopeptide (TPR) repeat protein